MIRNNLVGFVKMAIIGNPNVDNATATTLCQYVEDLKVLIDTQDSLVKALRADLDGTCRTVDGLRNEGLDLQVSNERLTRRINELLNEVQILEERNHNQAIMLSRKDRN